MTTEIRHSLDDYRLRGLLSVLSVAIACVIVVAIG